MFKWLGKKIEKFTTIFHGGVVIEKESEGTSLLSVTTTENLTSSAYSVAEIVETKTTGTGDGLSSTTQVLSLTSNDTSTNHANSIVQRFGLSCYLTGGTTGGADRQTGISSRVTGIGSSDTKGILTSVTNGGDDIVMYNNVDERDYCAISVGAEGATKIRTFDADTAAGHFEIEADGNIILDAAGDIALECAGGDLTCDADTVTFSSGNADDPTVIIQNTRADNQGARLQMKKDRGAAMAANDRVGEIDFIGEDADQNTQQYAKILVQADVVTGGQESGKMRFQVASHDGFMENALILVGGDEDAEVDATIGLGANSVVTIPGNIDLAGDIDVDGTLETDALTIGGTNVVTGSLITTLGTISAGTWQGTAIATGYTKHLSYYEFMGFNNNTSEDIYQHASPMTDTKAPFEHDVDHNADITTAMVVGTYFKAGGQVVPRAGTITLINGWAHTNGTSAEHKIALVRLRPAEAASDPVSPVSIGETTWTSLGNNKLKSLRIASLSVAVAAGDILMTMIYDDTGGRTVFFNLTVEIET